MNLQTKKNPINQSKNHVRAGHQKVFITIETEAPNRLPLILSEIRLSVFWLLLYKICNRKKGEKNPYSDKSISHTVLGEEHKPHGVSYSRNDTENPQHRWSQCKGAAAHSSALLLYSKTHGEHNGQGRTNNRQKEEENTCSATRTTARIAMAAVSTQRWVVTTQTHQRYDMKIHTDPPRTTKQHKIVNGFQKFTQKSNAIQRGTCKSRDSKGQTRSHPRVRTSQA